MKVFDARFLMAGLLCAALQAPVVAQLQATQVRSPWIGYPTSLYPQGLAPRDGVLVDLNGDGHLDVATVSNPVNSRLTVSLGDGMGGFLPAVPTALAVGGDSLVAADLEGDGDLDLVLADTGQGTSTNTVSVYSNQGDGTFAPGVAWSVGGPAKAVAVADIDGDGRLDIVAALIQSVGLLLGNGDGTFQPPLAFIVATGVTDVVTGDIEGDGDIDVIVGHSSSQISVLPNIGIGFGLPVSYASIPSGSFNGDANVHVADFDLDGDLDALLSSTSTGTGPGGIGFGAIAFFRNAGNGTFGTAETVPMDPAGSGAVDIEVADVTGDGWPDLVATTGTSYWVLIAGDGAGGFLPPITHDTGGGPTAVEVGDLNGDSAPEVVIVAGGAMDLSVHLNTGGGVFFDPRIDDMIDGSLAPASSSKLLSSDIDLDGDLDVIVGYSENFNGKYGISVRRNQGDGTLAPAELYETTQFPEWMVLGDVDADGYPDLVWLDGWGAFNAKIRLKRNLGTGSFGPTTVLPGNYCEQDADILLHDLTGDGMPEILAYTCWNQVYALVNEGGGVFLEPKVTNVSSGSGGLGCGDFNGDGFGDLVTNSGIQGYVEVSLGLGTGLFMAPLTVITGRGVEAISVGDLNEDGQPDIIAAYQLDGDGVSVLLGLPNGTFEPTVNYPGTYSGYTDDVTLGDLDGDGHLDVLVADNGAQEISFWLGQGDGSLAPQRRFGVGHRPTSLAAGDYTGDGRADLMVLVEPNGARNWYYPAVSLLEGMADPWTDMGQGLGGTHGLPQLTGVGSAMPGTNFQVGFENALENAPVFLVGGLNLVNLPLRGGLLLPSPDLVLVMRSDAQGRNGKGFNWPTNGSIGMSGLQLYFQAWVRDPAAVQGFSISNGLSATQP